jgi:putrescine transport system substrate-binding protein
MAKISADDPGNAYGVIYAWGTNGLIYNESKIADAVPTAAVKSWSLILDPANAVRLAHCHVNTIDTPAAVVPIALLYLRRDVQNPTPQDLNDVAALLDKMRPYIHNIDTGGLIEAMANGDACVALDSNGDAFQARSRAKEAHNGGCMTKSTNPFGVSLGIPVIPEALLTRSPEHHLHIESPPRSRSIFTTMK